MHKRFNQCFYNEKVCWVVFFLNVQVGDRVEMKKTHPCGSRIFRVLRVGMDFKIRCEGCGREVMVPRNKIEKNIKKIIEE